MDPDAALVVIREEIDRVDSDDFDADRLANAVAGLDQWLSRGGFLPDAWSR